MHCMLGQFGTLPYYYSVYVWYGNYSKTVEIGIDLRHFNGIRQYFTNVLVYWFILIFCRSSTFTGLTISDFQLSYYL
jgi:hypothetical protein